MAISYEHLAIWFDRYFQAFNDNSGPLATVVNMKKYFAEDLQFVPYNMAGGKALSREGLLMTMVHPGLQEHLTPLEYVIDLKKMIAVVLFRVEFSDQVSGQVWPAKHASAHYYLVLDQKNEPKIKKIVYFMEQRPPEEGSYREPWIKYREAEMRKNGKLVEQLK